MNAQVDYQNKTDIIILQHHALDIGVASIEADIFLSSSGPDTSPTPQLLVGHDVENLDPTRSLKRVYLDPLYEILDRVNRQDYMHIQKTHTYGYDPTRGWNGIYTDKNAPGETLLLHIDFKTYTLETWTQLLAELEPLKQRQWLTTFTRHSNATELSQGVLDIKPITIIGTGDTPTDKVIAQNPRYVFRDAHLLSLHKPIPNMVRSVWTHNHTQEDASTPVYWDASFAPIASDAFPWYLYPTVWLSNRFTISPVQKYISRAHRLGIQVRWWGVISRPRWLMRMMWKYLKYVGVDWLNVDDLEMASQFEHKRWAYNGTLC